MFSSVADERAHKMAMNGCFSLYIFSPSPLSSLSLKIKPVVL